MKGSVVRRSRKRQALCALFWYSGTFLVGLFIGMIMYLTIHSYAMSDSLFTFCMELF